MAKKTIVLTSEAMAEAASARDDLRARGYEVAVVPADVCLWDEAALRAWAAPLAGGLLGVIHPAPEMIRGSVEGVSEADFDRACDEGPMAAWCVCKVFCGLMAENGGGSLIFLNSIHAEKPVGFGALYSMGCGAAQMLAREAAQDYGEAGVRVFFIQKGVSAADPDAKSPVSTLYFGADLRTSRRVYPGADELNALIAFLLTPGAALLSGSDLRADDGMTLYYNHRRRVEGRPYFDWKH